MDGVSCSIALRQETILDEHDAWLAANRYHIHALGSHRVGAQVIDQSSGHRVHAAIPTVELEFLSERLRFQLSAYDQRLIMVQSRVHCPQPRPAFARDIGWPS